MMKKIIVFILITFFVPSFSTAATTWSTVEKYSQITLSSGNLKATVGAQINWQAVRAAHGNSSGKRYYEITVNVGIAGVIVSGVVNDAYDATLIDQYGILGWMSNATLFNCGTGAYGTSAAAGSIIMIATDLDTGKTWYGKNGSWFNSGNPATGANPACTLTTGTKYYPAALINAGGSNAVTAKFTGFTYSAPSGFIEWGPEISGTLKEKESSASGAAYDYAILDVTNHTLFEYDTAGETGAYPVTVTNGTDEYCGVIIDNIGGAVYSGDFGTDTTDEDGAWSITNANWVEGDTVWAFFVDPDKIYRTAAFPFTVNASHNVADTHNEAGSAAEGTLVYALDFGTATGYEPPNPEFDFATGN